MNKVNDYETLLELANKDLKQYNVQLSVLVIDDLGEYDVNVEHLDSGTIDNYAEGYYEDELSDIINEAWADAKKTALKLKAAMRVRAKEEAKKKYVLTNEMHLIGESIQEITLQAWPVIWDGNKYDQDSRDVLMTIREWGVEFEQWWMSHDEDWRDMHHYLEEVDKFADKKCKEYLNELGVEPVTEKKPEPEVRGHIEETIDVLLDLADVCHDRLVCRVNDRDEEHRLLNEWAREFSKWYYIDLSLDEQIEKDYFSEIYKFADKKFEGMQLRDGVKKYSIRVERNLYRYVTVEAYSDEEASRIALEKCEELPCEEFCYTSEDIVDDITVEA